MIYERDGALWRSTGTDVWIFERRAEDWIAVWRMMLDLEETGVAGA